MAGPTTESLDVDVKGLREDLRRVEVSLLDKIGSVKDDLSGRINDLEVGVGKLSTKLNMVVGILGILSTASLGVGIKGLVEGSYWAGSLNTSVKSLEERSRATDARLDKLEASIEERSRATDARLDKLTASIAKILEQTKPPEKP